MTLWAFWLQPRPKSLFLKCAERLVIHSDSRSFGVFVLASKQMVDIINQTSNEARELLRRAAHALEEATRGHGAFADLDAVIMATVLAITAIESATRLLRQLKRQRP
jgi:hypothetical protein